MPKKYSAFSTNIFTQSVYLFSTIVAFFSGVISAPIFMYLSNNYYDVMISMGDTRVILSLFIVWLMITIIFAVLLAEVSGMMKPTPKVYQVRAKAKSKKR